MTTGSSNSGESVADRIIRQAMEAGEFDDLSGEGKPIPGAGQPDDEDWWIRNWVRRNRDSTEDESSGGSEAPHSGTPSRH